MLLRKGHGRLAAHGMAQQMEAGELQVVHQLQQVFGHHGVVEHRVVGRVAVVALVHQDHLVVLGKALAQGLPVVRRAEEPVEDEQGFGVLLAEDAVVEFHGRNAAWYMRTVFSNPK